MRLARWNPQQEESIYFTRNALGIPLFKQSIKALDVNDVIDSGTNVNLFVSTAALNEQK